MGGFGSLIEDLRLGLGFVLDWLGNLGKLSLRGLDFKFERVSVLFDSVGKKGFGDGWVGFCRGLGRQ